jgi:DNA polymerase III subunit chi
MDILFYHLERRPLDAVLPSLLEKTMERGARALVKVGSEERLRVLDDLLWTYRDESFLPHGTAQDGAPEAQPILLTLEDDRPNHPAYLFLVDGAAPPDLSAMAHTTLERIILLFDGTDPDALDGARAQWKSWRETSHQLTYWQQNEQGRWEKKA